MCDTYHFIVYQNKNLSLINYKYLLFNMQTFIKPLLIA